MKPGAWGWNSPNTLFNLAGIGAGWFVQTPPPSTQAAMMAKQTCDASFRHEMGHVTLAIEFDRKGTVETSVRNLVPEWIAPTVGKIARSHLFRGALGAGYGNISGEIVGQSGPSIQTTMKDMFLDVFYNAEETIFKEETALGVGKILMEFKICKVGDSVKFFQCFLTADNQYIGRAMPLGDFFAIYSWTLWSKFPGFEEWILHPQVMKGIVSTLPGQVFTQLFKALGAEANANVCVFPQRIREGGGTAEDLFRRMDDPNECPQQEVADPIAYPDDGSCGDPPETGAENGDDF
jgi:hypothetical protein